MAKKIQADANSDTTTTATAPIDNNADGAAGATVEVKPAPTATAPIDNNADGTAGATVEVKPAPTGYYVSVKKESRWQTLQVAGRSWGITPVLVSANAADLPDLMANEYLDVVAAEE